jgi:S-disulfanyl-L-cysteine oxidoreductase SoxD
MTHERQIENRTDVARGSSPARHGTVVVQGFSPACLGRPKGLHYFLAVIFVLLSLSGAAQQAPPMRSVWDGVYTAEQSRRGEPLYAQNCSSCHGPMLEGGEMAPPLAGGAFNANWNGLSLGDLSERIRISMPQNSPGSLSRQQYADILAVMLGAGEFPQGTAELPREVEALKQIAFESMKKN